MLKANLAWYGMLIFWLLSIFDMRFGLLASLCMIYPFIQAYFYKKKSFCVSRCPRGIFLKIITYKLSKKAPPPKFFLKKKFKNAIIIVIGTFFFISLLQTKGNPFLIGFTFFRMITVSTIIGIFLGYFFTPRAWCIICPIGTISSQLKSIADQKNEY